MPVPVRIEMADGTSVERTVTVDEPEESFELSFEGKPKSLVFNPDHAVLRQDEERLIELDRAWRGPPAGV